MTTQEFSVEFDILYNSIASDAAPGFNDYEKSVLLTQAQEELIKAYFSAKKNKVREGFDDSVERQYDFSSIIKTVSLENIDDKYTFFEDNTSIRPSSNKYILPIDFLFTINESFDTDSGIHYNIVPLSYKEYELLDSKPFRYPPKRQIWKLISKNTNEHNSTGTYTLSDTNRDYLFGIKSRTTKDLTIYFTFNNTTKLNGKDATVTDIVEDDTTVSFYLNSSSNSAHILWLGFLYNEQRLKAAKLNAYISPLLFADSNPLYPSVLKNYKNFTLHISNDNTKVPVIELIGNNPLKGTYTLRYVRKPNPIILADLSEIDMSIDGKQNITECELPSNMHREILQRAVELAKAYYTGGLQEQLVLGNQSSTDKGILTQQS